MKAQRHGNVFAMEISRGTRKPDNWRCVLAFVVVAGLGIAGCGFPPKDNNGDVPSDVVRQFIELCEAEDYESARKLWFGPSERVPPMTFESFCERYKKIGSGIYQVSRAVESKVADLWSVRVDFEEDGQKRHVFFYIKVIDGQWKLRRGRKW